MTTHTIPQSEEQARVRLRGLLAQVTVTNVVTGARIEGMGKNGCVAAAVRGAPRTLYTVDWGTTTPDEVRQALDALRGAE